MKVVNTTGTSGNAMITNIIGDYHAYQNEGCGPKGAPSATTGYNGTEVFLFQQNTYIDG